MNTHTVTITDPSGTVVARGRVTEEQGMFTGIMDLTEMSHDLRAVFDNFAETVSQGVFSRLDAVEDPIRELRLEVVFEDGQRHSTEDLQIFRSGADGSVSFRLAKGADGMSAGTTADGSISDGRAMPDRRGTGIVDIR